MFLNITPRLETELLQLYAAEEVEQFVTSPHLRDIQTSIDILEVTRSNDTPGEAAAVWKVNLGRDEIVEYAGNANKEASRPTLTLFFLKNKDSDIGEDGDILVDADTMKALQHAYKIPPTYVYECWQRDHALAATCLDCFATYSNNQLAVIEGTYAFDILITGMYPAVHFNYDISRQSAVYFLACCPDELLKRLRNFDAHKLTIPFMVDLVVSEYYLTRIVHPCLLECVNHVLKNEIVGSEPDIGDMYTDLRVTCNSITRLERFNQHLSFLNSVIKLMDNTQTTVAIATLTHITEALQSQQRRANTLLYEHRNLQKRLEIQVNLRFGLRAQRDSDANLRTAKDTAIIAQDAQNDSASMITIAAVTMFFLPGTFICAVFSMVFFNTGIDAATGANTFSVSPKIWYFFAATVPLTILVFVIWLGWTRRRRHSKATKVKMMEEGVTEDIESVSRSGGDSGSVRSRLDKTSLYQKKDNADLDEGDRQRAKSEGKPGVKEWFGWVTSRTKSGETAIEPGKEKIT